MTISKKDFPLKIRGRRFTLEELEQIRELIASGHFKNRTVLSREICALFNWRQTNGRLKDMACRYVLLKLHRAGLITLPPSQRKSPRLTRILRTADAEPQFPIIAEAGQLQEIQLHQVSNARAARLFKEYLDRYHYLGYRTIVGPQLRYLIQCPQGYLGCIAFASAAWKVAPRDQWIGWDDETRMKNLPFIINNVRFLILPWIKSKNLASKILSQCARIIPEHWQERYGYRPLMFETFVDKERFHGTCYKAANWLYTGDTKGRGKWDQYNQNLSTIKEIYLYPLAKNAKHLLRYG